MSRPSAAGNGTEPAWYQDIRHFADDGLLNAAAVAGGVAMVLYGIAVLRSRALAAWSGVLAVAFGALLVALYLAGGVIPAVRYVAGLPFGFSALVSVIPAILPSPRGKPCHWTCAVAWVSEHQAQAGEREGAGGMTASAALNLAPARLRKTGGDQDRPFQVG